MIIGWRAWYPDRIVTSRDCDPGDLDDGIVGVVQYYAHCTACGTHYREVFYGGDWYGFEGSWFVVPNHPVPGRWVAFDDARAMYPDAVLIRSAPMIADEHWEAIEQDMMDAR